MEMKEREAEREAAKAVKTEGEKRGTGVENQRKKAENSNIVANQTVKPKCSVLNENQDQIDSYLFRFERFATCSGLDLDHASQVKSGRHRILLKKT